MFSVLGSVLSSVDSSVLKSGDPEQTVAVIDIEGTITTTPLVDFWGNTALDMVSQVRKQLDEVKEDDNVKAVVLRVNSPGGEVYGTRLLYNKILELQEAEKKVVVLMEDTAASGGYYISTPADWIVASEMSLTGSIGVRISTLDLKGLYEKIGIEEINIANTEGDLKVLDDLSEGSPGYEVLQGITDDYFNNFVEVIVAGRSLSKAEVLEVADGRVYSGRQALDNGLIDQLGEQDTAFEKAAELAELDNPNFVVYNNNPNSISGYGMELLQLLSPELTLSANLAEGDFVKGYYLLN